MELKGKAVRALRRRQKPRAAERSKKEKVMKYVARERKGKVERWRKAKARVRERAGKLAAERLRRARQLAAALRKRERRLKAKARADRMKKDKLAKAKAEARRAAERRRKW